MFPSFPLPLFSPFGGDQLILSLTASGEVRTQKYDQSPCTPQRTWQVCEEEEIERGKCRKKLTGLEEEDRGRISLSVPDPRFHCRGYGFHPWLGYHSHGLEDQTLLRCKFSPKLIYKLKAVPVKILKGFFGVMEIGSNIWILNFLRKCKAPRIVKTNLKNEE